MPLRHTLGLALLTPGLALAQYGGNQFQGTLDAITIHDHGDLTHTVEIVVTDDLQDIAGSLTVSFARPYGGPAPLQPSVTLNSLGWTPSGETFTFSPLEFADVALGATYLVTIGVVDDSGFTQGLLQELVTVTAAPPTGPTPTEVISGTTVGDVTAGPGDVIQVLGTIDGDAVLSGGVLLLESGASVTGTVLAHEGVLTSHGGTVDGVDIGGDVTIDGTGLTVVGGLTGRGRGAVVLAAPIAVSTVDLRTGSMLVDAPLSATGTVDLRARGDAEGHGSLVLNDLLDAADDIFLRSAGDGGLVANAPVTSDTGAVRMRAVDGGDLLVHDGLRAGGEISLKGKGGGRVSPTCDLTAEAGLCILGGQRIQVTSDGIVEIDAALSSATDVKLRAGGDLVLGAPLDGGEDVVLRTTNGGSLLTPPCDKATATINPYIHGRRLNTNIDGSADLQCGVLVSEDAQLRSGGDLTVSHPLSAGGDLVLRAGRAGEPADIAVDDAELTGEIVWVDARGDLSVAGSVVAGELVLLGDEVSLTDTTGDGTAVVGAATCTESNNAFAGGIVGCN